MAELAEPLVKEVSRDVAGTDVDEMLRADAKVHDRAIFPGTRYQNFRNTVTGTIMGSTSPILPASPMVSISVRQMSSPPKDIGPWAPVVEVQLDERHSDRTRRKRL